MIVYNAEPLISVRKQSNPEKKGIYTMPAAGMKLIMPCVSRM